MDEKRLVQIGTRLDKETYKKAKAQAAVEGRRVGQLIDDAIEEYLAKRRILPAGRVK